MARDFNPSDTGYNDVASRIVEFRTKYPNGSLQPNDRSNTYEIKTIGDQTFIVYVAAAYRDADDKLPGIGSAWEPFPGKTPYTRGSELQNAETSAWGRAIVAALSADTKQGVASMDEILSRAANNDRDEERVQKFIDDFRSKVREAKTKQDITRLVSEGRRHSEAGLITSSEAEYLVRLVNDRDEEIQGGALQRAEEDLPDGV